MSTEKKRENYFRTYFLFLLVIVLLLITIPTQVFALTYLWNTPLILDSAGNVGEFTSIAEVNGNPAISYFDHTNSALKFIRAANASGTSWNSPQTLDNAGNVGYFTSLAVVNGNPAISYCDYTNGDLKFIRATNTNGTTWGTPQIPDGTDSVGEFTSLTVVNGHPAISYFDSTNGSLKYVRATDPSGNSWGTPQTLDNTAVVGRTNSLKVVNGHPAISYYDSTNHNLKFIRALDADGRTWSSPQILDNSGDYVAFPSLAVINGYPAVSYFGSTNRDLKFIRAIDVNGTNWESPQILDSTGNVGEHSSLGMIDGNPAISYSDATNGNLKFIHATDANGILWGSPHILDNSVDVGWHTSLAVINGSPVISYRDYAYQDLKFISANSVDITVREDTTQINNNTSFDFGPTVLGTPTTIILTIQNNGNTSLDLNILSLPDGYSLTGIYPNQIPASGSQNIQIRLDAYQIGTFTGDLEIDSADSSQSPFTITLDGEVTQDSLSTDLIAPFDGSTVLDSEVCVSFNHDVLHDGSADAANNPVNYLLVEDGVNGIFDTTTCLLGLAGDDLQMPISSVTYDDSTFTATLNTAALPSGRYRLLVCGTASIQDLTGNVLNDGVFDSSTTFTVVSGATGSGAATASDTVYLPATGFAPDQQTMLSAQPDSLAYSDMDALTLQIPSLKVDVPIVGVPQTANGWDVTWLTNAQAGWLNGTAYPTWDGNTVLTGHVTNASGNPGPFANIKTLKFGDQITIQAYGEEYTYEVRENKLVSSDDMSVVEEHKSRDWITLITCETFNENTGQYLFRRIIRAVLVEME